MRNTTTTSVVRRVKPDWQESGVLPAETAVIPQIGAETRLFCVLGHPVRHSLSPAMQNAALRELGIDGVYVAFDVAPEALPEAVAGLRALGVAGVNCTIPHKEALLSLVDELSPEAAAIGAVNTLVPDGGRWIGHNTDAPGFLAALRAEGVQPGGRAVVLGAGGSARAVVDALARAGTEVVLANRTAERSRELAGRVNTDLGRVTVRCVTLDPEELGREVSAAGLLVNTTSLGMHPRVEEGPPVPAGALYRGLVVYDLIYNPLETKLLRTARERGARGINGAGMLAHQGALALELWTGRSAPAALMHQVILEQLGRRQQSNE